MFEHPLDLVKVRLRTSGARLRSQRFAHIHFIESQPIDQPLKFKGPLDCMVQTFQGEGIKGLWRVRRGLSAREARR